MKFRSYRHFFLHLKVIRSQRFRCAAISGRPDLSKFVLRTKFGKHKTCRGFEELQLSYRMFVLIRNRFILISLKRWSCKLKLEFSWVSEIRRDLNRDISQILNCAKDFVKIEFVEWDMSYKVRVEGFDWIATYLD